MTYKDQNILKPLLPINNHKSLLKMAPVALSYQDVDLPEITLSEYIFRRIVSLGIHSIFGVPGDFNLDFLDCIYKVPELHWYGTCNELNGAYSADGYARRSGKLGVLLTTMGVGELSAMNGISGSYAEYVPILSIVGTTSRADKKLGLANHHLVTSMNPLRGSDHYTYQKMAANISCQVTSIENAVDAPDQIDALIAEILKEKRPGYLYLPCDLATAKVSPSNLSTRAGSTFFDTPINNPTRVVSEIADMILKDIYQSKEPCILSDCLVDRFGMAPELQKFVDMTKLPNSVTPMGKSTLDEQSPYYVGDFTGRETAKETKHFVDSCDLLLHVGNYDNETNTGHYSNHEGFGNGRELILLNHKYIKIGDKLFDGYKFQDVLREMINRVDISKVPKVTPPSIKNHIDLIKSKTPISESDVLQSIQKLLQPNDTLVVDTGSILYGISDIKLPHNVKVLTQPFYLSIGMGLPCSFGASVAHREFGNKGRVILVEGDGAAQMTIQELSNFNREGLNPLILLLNNDGYTVERALKGPTREYNDIRPNWKWTQIFDTFGMKDYKCKRVDELDDMRRTLSEFGNDNNCARLVEIGLDKLDWPWRFNGMLHSKK